MHTHVEVFLWEYYDFESHGLTFYDFESHGLALIVITLKQYFYQVQSNPSIVSGLHGTFIRPVNLSLEATTGCSQ